MLHSTAAIIIAQECRLCWLTAYVQQGHICFKSSSTFQSSHLSLNLFIHEILETTNLINPYYKMCIAYNDSISYLDLANIFSHAL